MLYDARIIMEYLDERFPHPALHQMDPVSRANARMLIKSHRPGMVSLLEEIQVQWRKKSRQKQKTA